MPIITYQLVFVIISESQPQLLTYAHSCNISRAQSLPILFNRSASPDVDYVLMLDLLAEAWIVWRAAVAI
jgi:hypothetical protein